MSQPTKATIRSGKADFVFLAILQPATDYNIRNYGVFMFG